MLAHWKELGVMPSLEERVAYLEGRFSEHMQVVGALRGDGALLRADMHQRFEEVKRQFEQVDKRFEQVDKRFEQIDKRFEQVDKRFERVDGRLESMDQKIDRHFIWLAGTQVAILLAIVGTVLRGYFR